MPTVEANGITISYTEKGSGDPLICIMGITAPGAVWEAHAEEWSKHFRCIMPDNRGVGATDKPEGPYTSAMMADDYAALMDALGIEKARVVGCSMGSIIAQQLMLRHPEKVSSAILMCPWARCDRYAKYIFDHMVNCKARFTPGEFMHWLQTLIFTKPFFDNDDCFASLAEGQQGADLDPTPQPLHGLAAQAEACKNHDVFADLGKITAPCLVIGGKNDIFTPLWMANEVAGGIPNSETYFYDDAGHAFHFEHMADFNARTSEWLQAH
ncbi:putative non-heme bromoperoxidase BpoC [Rubritalea halochordaticola]|uniref:Non-heme bromoperoxidase BpoC n=1 Tax=Rubritalea halochordaticola TaxID=714537 RepID=A0ABP9UZZ2_9BACT